MSSIRATSFPIYIRLYRNLSHVGEIRLQTAVSIRDDKPRFRPTAHENTCEANTDTDMVVNRVFKVAEAQRPVPFPNKVPGIERGSENLGDSANLKLEWVSRMVLSRSKMQGATSARTAKL